MGSMPGSRLRWMNGVTLFPFSWPPSSSNCPFVLTSNVPELRVFGNLWCSFWVLFHHLVFLVFTWAERASLWWCSSAFVHCFWPSSSNARLHWGLELWGPLSSKDRPQFSVCDLVSQAAKVSGDMRSITLMQVCFGSFKRSSLLWDRRNHENILDCLITSTTQEFN